MPGRIFLMVALASTGDGTPVSIFATHAWIEPGCRHGEGASGSTKRAITDWVSFNFESRF